MLRQLLKLSSKIQIKLAPVGRVFEKLVDEVFTGATQWKSWRSNIDELKTVSRVLFHFTMSFHSFIQAQQHLAQMHQ